jgi:hypothetical protein
LMPDFHENFDSYEKVEAYAKKNPESKLAISFDLAKQIHAKTILKAADIYLTRETLSQWQQTSDLRKIVEILSKKVFQAINEHFAGNNSLRPLTEAEKKAEAEREELVDTYRFIL